MQRKRLLSRRMTEVEGMRRSLANSRSQRRETSPGDGEEGAAVKVRLRQRSGVFYGMFATKGTAGASGGDRRKSVQMLLDSKRQSSFLRSSIASSAAVDTTKNVKQEQEDGVAAALRTQVPISFVVQDVRDRVLALTTVNDLWYYLFFLGLFMFYFLASRSIEQDYYFAGGARQADTLESSEQFSSTKSTIDEIYRRDTEEIYSGDPTKLHRQFYVSADDAEEQDARVAGSVSAVRNEFLKVTSVDLFIQWIGNVFIPTYWDCQSPTFSREVLSRPRGSAAMIGAARIRTLHTENVGCSLPEEFGSDKVPLCAVTSPRSKIATSPFCNRPNPMQPGTTLFRFSECAFPFVQVQAEKDVISCSGYVAEMPFSATCTSARELMVVLSPEVIMSTQNPDYTLQRINPQTAMTSAADCSSFLLSVGLRLAAVEYYAYLPATNSFLQVKAVIEVTAGGGVVPTYTTRIFKVWSSNELIVTIFEFFFLAFVLYFIRKLLSDWSTSKRREGTYLVFLMDPWNVLEAVNLVTFVVSIALRWSWWLSSRGLEVRFNEDPHFPAELDGVEYKFSIQIYANAVNVVFTFLKMLRYLRISDRLNVLTRAVSHCQSELTAVLSLFVLIHTGFALAAMMIYGARMKNFKNFNSSFSSLLFFVVGEFPYEEMRKYEPILTPLFFWIYWALGTLIFRNFFIVVLSDGFAQIMRQTSLLPLHVQVMRLVDELRLRLRWRYVREWAKGITEGADQIEALVTVCEFLREHREMHADAVQSTLGVEHTDQLYMAFRDLRWWVPRDALDVIGDEFLRVMWEDIVYRYRVREKQTLQFFAREVLRDSIRGGAAAYIHNNLPDFLSMEVESEKLNTRLGLVPAQLCRTSARTEQ